MISIARGAMTEPRLAQRQLHFLYGARTEADICDEDILRELLKETLNNPPHKAA